MRFMQGIGVMTTLCLGGCTRHEDDRMGVLAQAFQENWPQTSHLKMICSTRDAGKSVFLHCALENGGGMPIAFNRSNLPWINPAKFHVNVLTSDGRTPPRPPEPVEVAQIGPVAERTVLQPNEKLEGDLELTADPGRLLRPIGELPRDRGLFFLWSCFLQPESPEENGYLTGIAYLAPHATWPAKAETRLDPPRRPAQ